MGMTTHGIDMTTEAKQHRYDTIIILTRQGYSAEHIARLLGITTRSVVRNRRKAGIAQPPAPYLSDAELATAQTLLEDGASYGEVGRTLGRSQSAIANRLPGYAWNRDQSSAYAVMCKRLNQLKVPA